MMDQYTVMERLEEIAESRVIAAVDTALQSEDYEWRPDPGVPGVWGLVEKAGRGGNTAVVVFYPCSTTYPFDDFEVNEEWLTALTTTDSTDSTDSKEQ